MIVKFKGNIENINPDSVDIDVNGVIYRILITSRDIKKLKNIGDRLIINIFEIIREDSRLLFGFLDLKEKQIFEDLIKVQGVGGKMALNVISELQSEEIINSLRNDILSNFIKISGIGKKLAQRIITELKDKVSDEKLFKTSTFFVSDEAKTLFDDLYSCIINLGYHSKIAEDVTRQIISENKNKELEELIPLALKILKIQSK